jgi:hypothetical protein
MEHNKESQEEILEAVVLNRSEAYPDGEPVATSIGDVREADIHIDGLPQLTCFSLPKIKLERMVIFQVLQRRPLSDFLNGALLRLDYKRLENERAGWRGRMIEPVYYVHGRVETFRGETTVSAVVLAYVHGEIGTRELASKLPEIYKEFSKAI